MALAKMSRGLQSVIFVGVAVLVLHLYYQQAYKPMVRQMRHLKLEKSEIQQEMFTFESGQSEIGILDERYQEAYSALIDLKDEVNDIEAALPSRSEMAFLLKQLTDTLAISQGDFLSLEPTMEPAEEGEVFDSIDIELQFYAGFGEVVAYLQKLEGTDTLLGIQSVEMELGHQDSPKPLSRILFSTYVSDLAAPKSEKVEEVVASQVAPEPFRLDNRPYDQTLPGDHRLSMVVWRGGKATALIDGKVMKEGSRLDAFMVTKIESDGVWLSRDGVAYYLGLET